MEMNESRMSCPRTSGNTLSKSRARTAKAGNQRSSDSSAKEITPSEWRCKNNIDATSVPATVKSHGRLDLSIAQGELKANRNGYLGTNCAFGAARFRLSRSPLPTCGQLARAILWVHFDIWPVIMALFDAAFRESTHCRGRVLGNNGKKTRLRIQATSTIESGVRLSALLICQEY